MMIGGREPTPAWLTARPIAHRGLHDADQGRVENTLDAARAALVAGYAIECDVQRTRDGEAVVFHDLALERLTPVAGFLNALTLEELSRVPLRASVARIPSLLQLLETVAGTVPVICEIKSGFDGDMRLAERVAEIAAAYPGPLALKSFDPTVIAHLRRTGSCRALLGMVAQASFDGKEWGVQTPAARHALANFLHFEATRPDFVSFRADDLPHAVPFLCRAGLGLPIIAWTVRDPAAAPASRVHCDQIVFEGFRPRVG